MSEWHSAAGVRRVPMTRALFVAFERVTGTAEYVGDDEGDLRQRILAAGDDTFHYNIVGPYVRAELRTEAARHNFRGVFTCEHCGKPRGAEEHERDSADDQPVQWDVPAEMLAKAHDHIARLRGVLVGCGDHDHVVRESFEAMPEVGDQMSKFAHRRERASHAATGAGGGDEDDVKRCRAVSPSAPGGARTCILTYHATGDHTDGAWTWTQEETCQTTRSQEPSSSLSSSGSSSPGASSPSAAPNASKAPRCRRCRLVVGRSDQRCPSGAYCVPIGWSGFAWDPGYGPDSYAASVVHRDIKPAKSADSSSKALDVTVENMVCAWLAGVELVSEDPLIVNSARLLRVTLFTRAADGDASKGDT